MASGNQPTPARRYVGIIGRVVCLASLFFAVGASHLVFADAQFQTASTPQTGASAGRAEELLQLAKREFGTLSPLEGSFFEAVARGNGLVLSAGSEKNADSSSAEQWGADHVLRADRIVWLCVDPEASRLITRRGIAIERVRIDGLLDLSFREIPFLLYFRNCAFTDKIDLRFAEIRDLSLEGTSIREIDATGLKAAGMVVLSRVKARGEVGFMRARIEGDLNCDGGEFNNKGGKALNLDGAHVGGTIGLRDAKTQGEINLVGATIGSLQCDPAEFVNESGYALQGSGVVVPGGIFLRDNFKALGGIDLVASTIGLGVQCVKARMTSSNEDGAFVGVHMKVGGELELRDCVIEGRVNLEECTTELATDLRGSSVSGMVDLAGAKIGTRLDCSNLHLHNLDGVALNANGAEVEGDVLLRNGFAANGEVNLVQAHVGRSLECEGGHFINSTGMAIVAESLTVGNNVVLGAGFNATGGVFLARAHIGGELMCAGGQITSLRSNALIAADADIGGSVFVGEGFNLEGTVSFAGATIRNFFYWRELHTNSNITLDLRFAKVRGLADESNSWPSAANLILNGFVYDGIGTKSPKDARSRISWLHLQPTDRFLPQPYEQLAEVLRKTGHEEDAVEVLIAKNEEHLRYTKRFVGNWWWYGFFGKAIGYGYRPMRALWISAGFIVLGYVLFHLGHKADLVTHTKEEVEEGQVKFNALFYSLETFVPLVNLQLAAHWLPDANRGKHLSILRIKLTTGSLLRLYRWLHISMGWILTTLWVGALAGLIKS